MRGTWGTLIRDGRVTETVATRRSFRRQLWMLSAFLWKQPQIPPLPSVGRDDSAFWGRGVGYDGGTGRLHPRQMVEGFGADMAPPLLVVVV